MIKSFSLPWPNPDLDTHPDPVEGWHRVAVVGLWTDAKKLRKDWPDAAVVGPLRTLRGIDLLVRGLLANPQIRVLVVVGRDLSPGERTRVALEGLWEAWDRSDYHPDWKNAGAYLVGPQGVALTEPAWMDFGGLEIEGRKGRWSIGPLPNEDRPGGAIILPPPEPKADAPMPPELPGQRVSGKTLADVWPRVLAEVMRFGAQVPTQYGDTKELLNLVSVIEDPARSLEEFGRGGGYEPTPTGMAFKAPPHPLLGISWGDLDDYYTKSFMSETPPEGQSYGYGSRLHGRDEGGRMFYDARDEYDVPGPPPDQIAAARKLLTDNPGTRAAFLTPWRPDEDAGRESGGPCMVGAWFRAVPSVYEWDIRLSGEATARPVAHKLNLTVTFRSHDLHGAYPLNLAACCLWLCKEAKALGMEVGTLTCISMSAHVYDRDCDAARAKAGIGVRIPAAGAFDMTVSFGSKAKAPSEDTPVMRTVLMGRHEGPVEMPKHDPESPAEPTRTFAYPKPPKWSQDARSAWRVWREADDRWTGGYRYHAEATDPEGTRVLATFQAPTKERLVKDIQASGLVSSVEHALWLGAEVGKL